MVYESHSEQLNKGMCYRWIIILICHANIYEADEFPRAHIRYYSLAASNFTSLNSVAAL